MQDTTKATNATQIQAFQPMQHHSDSNEHMSYRSDNSQASQDNIDVDLPQAYAVQYLQAPTSATASSQGQQFQVQHQDGFTFQFNVGTTRQSKPILIVLSVA